MHELPVMAHAACLANISLPGIVASNLLPLEAELDLQQELNGLLQNMHKVTQRAHPKCCLSSAAP